MTRTSKAVRSRATGFSPWREMARTGDRSKVVPLRTGHRRQRLSEGRHPRARRARPEDSRPTRRLHLNAAFPSRRPGSMRGRCSSARKCGMAASRCTRRTFFLASRRHSSCSSGPRVSSWRAGRPHAEPLTFCPCAISWPSWCSGLWPPPPVRPGRGRRRAGDGLVAGVLLHGLYLGGVFWAVRHGLPAGIAALVAGLQPLATGLLVDRSSASGSVPGGGAGSQSIPGRPRRRSSSARPTGLALPPSFASGASPSRSTIWQKDRALDMHQRFGRHLGAAAVTLRSPSDRTGPARPGAGTLDRAPGRCSGSIGAIGLLLFLIRRGAVAGVAALLYLVPPVSALMAYLLFGETLSPVQIAGMGVAATAWHWRAGVERHSPLQPKRGSTARPSAFMVQCTYPERPTSASPPPPRPTSWPSPARPPRRRTASWARRRAGSGPGIRRGAALVRAAGIASARGSWARLALHLRGSRARTRILCGAPHRRGPVRRGRGTPRPIGLGEYLDQIFGGIPMSQGEIVRLSALSLSAREPPPASVRKRWRC